MQTLHFTLSFFVKIDKKNKKFFTIILFKAV